MPRGNGSGPNGNGSMTGRRLGYCAGYDLPGFAKRDMGGGRRNGWNGRYGAGNRGNRHRRWATGYYNNDYYEEFQNSTAELNMLKNRSKLLKDEIDDIEIRIEELESKHPVKTDTEQTE